MPLSGNEIWQTYDSWRGGNDGYSVLWGNTSLPCFLLWGKGLWPFGQTISKHRLQLRQELTISFTDMTPVVSQTRARTSVNFAKQCHFQHQTREGCHRWETMNISRRKGEEIKWCENDTCIESLTAHTQSHTTTLKTHTDNVKKVVPLSSHGQLCYASHRLFSGMKPVLQYIWENICGFLNICKSVIKLSLVDLCVWPLQSLDFSPEYVYPL